MKFFIVLMALMFCVCVFAGGANAQACYQCIPTDDHSPPAGWKCLPGMYIGWATCLDGPTCNTHDQCGVGGGGCFLAGTQVSTRDGSVAIEDLGVGDEVRSESEDGSVTFCPVTRTYHTIQLSYYVINGDISVTGTHPFQIGGRWITAEDIKVGDKMEGMDGGEIVVASKEPVDFVSASTTSKWAGHIRFSQMECWFITRVRIRKES